MKTSKLIAACILSMMISCVQPSHRRLVVLYLHMNDSVKVSSAGVRGSGEPLSWDRDYIMTELIPNTLYKTSFIVKTGYKFGEIKFTRNGSFELEGRPNRKVYFSKSDSTVYHAVFNTP